MENVNQIVTGGLNELQPSRIKIADVSQRSQTFLYLRRHLLNCLALGAGDALALTVAFSVAGAIRWLLLGSSMISGWIVFVIIGWWVGALSARLLPSWGMGAAEGLRRMFLLMTMLYSAIAVVLFLGKQGNEVSRILLLATFAFSIFFVPALRTWVKRTLVVRRLWGLPTVVYGEPKTSALVIQTLQAEQGFGYLPIGVFGDSAELTNIVEGVPVLGRIDQYTLKAPVAILATPGMACEQIASLLDGPLSSYRQVVIIPNLFEVQCWLWVRARDLGGVLGLEITHNLLDPIAWWSKRALEVFAVVATAFVWIPLCLFLALIIWLQDHANPFFMQPRIGKDGLPFRTWKFRTMVPHAELVLQQKLAEDQALCNEWYTGFKLDHDPRITRLGRLLRKASLDELPQLINVLRGEMSLVGPRPLPRYHHDELPPTVRKLRERVRPGMTGLWQVSGRSEAGTAGMERWDTYYVSNWSVWLDAVVLVRTMRAVVKGHGAR